MFEPKFYDAQVTDNNGHVYTLNPRQFATKETAQALAERFNAIAVIERPFITGGGPFQSSPNQTFLLFPEGVEVIAGAIASYFLNAPEDKFPGVADQWSRAEIARATAYSALRK